MIPFLPVYIEDLDKVGQLHDEPVKVSRLDEEVIAGGEVEGLGWSGGGEVHLQTQTLHPLALDWQHLHQCLSLSPIQVKNS